MRSFYFLTLLCVIVFGSTFAALNADPVAINYYFGRNVLPLSLLMVLTLSLGGLLGVCASLGMVLKIKFENRSLKRQVKLAEKEVVNLRTLPLQDKH